MPTIIVLRGDSNICMNFYSLPTKLREGNVFTSVCQSFCPQRGGMGISGPMSIPGGGYVQGVGTHPLATWTWDTVQKQVVRNIYSNSMEFLKL